MLTFRKIRFLKEEKKKIYHFIIIRKVFPFFILNKIYPYLKRKYKLVKELSKIDPDRVNIKHLFQNASVELINLSYSNLFDKSKLLKKKKNYKDKNKIYRYKKFKSLFLNIFYYYIFVYALKISIKKRIIKQKNKYLNLDKNIIYNPQNIIIRVLATTRNVIISGFSKNNTLEFIYSMAAIKNQNNLKKKTFFACKLLIEKLLYFYLHKRNLFRFNNRIIFILYGYNRFYNLIFRVIAQNRIFHSGLIFKNNLPYNGCFKKKKKRK
jgi:hypothetical protein